MSKPSEEELKQALEEAIRMVEAREDPKFIAKALLNLNYRIGYLEKVKDAAERYVRFGLSEQEHSMLLKALDEFKHAEALSVGEEASEDIGL
ncbi:hypothetical protein BOW53_09940 [Solemya pervernicosa gill symbiont]|uniref:Uncharacterized protein n=2 Tax=Gammaproteobacteria incertae sedis TaxID=118884 RepID=A0A1T2L4H8_9GAMM|nr:hypothetical protein [Candidatus Reidiella endopervernicosa]OOZ39836.1 hypothetical protein BOW53_09940 [Solemya pervernicosa gill symbiont]QKQ27479.1 hypothetical protein HUE57_15205 [Candidatus Reidiella endopervernicosa]